MIGRAVGTTPTPQGGLGLDQKHACRKNQNNCRPNLAGIIVAASSDHIVQNGETAHSKPFSSFLRSSITMRAFILASPRQVSREREFY